MSQIIELQNISYSYHSKAGETRALQNVSFQVAEGEFIAIVGPSGCGKTTLLSIIAGLLKPDEGIALLTPHFGYMLQQDHLLEWRTIYKNVLLGLEINHQLTETSLANVNRMLKDYGLEQYRDKYPHELSGGLRQRAALIRTLALNPQLLLLDEPFSALDFQTRLMVSADICHLIRQAGKTMILITHDLTEAISLADRIIVLSKCPGTIKAVMDIHLTLQDDSPLAARNAPEFTGYLNCLWKEMTYET